MISNKEWTMFFKAQLLALLVKNLLLNYSDNTQSLHSPSFDACKFPCKTIVTMIGNKTTDTSRLLAVLTLFFALGASRLLQLDSTDVLREGI